MYLELNKVSCVQSFEDAVLPHLAALWPRLQVALDDTTRPHAHLKCDAAKVIGALQVSTAWLFAT